MTVRLDQDGSTLTVRSYAQKSIALVCPAQPLRPAAKIISGRQELLERPVQLKEAPVALRKKIEQNMEVVGRDGAHVGIVEQIEGTDEIKLAKDDPDAGGQERYIPLAWLAHTEIKVHLKLTGDEAKAM